MIFPPRTPDEKAALLAWASQRLPVDIRAETAYPLAVVRDGAVVAVCVYHEWRGCGIEMSMVAATPRWATKQTVGFLISYPFLTYDVRRVTALVARKNERARKMVAGFGFAPEGTMRHALPDDDLVIYGMTRKFWSRSKWFRELPADDRKAA